VPAVSKLRKTAFGLHTYLEQMYIADKLVDKVDYKENSLPKGEYENCTFKNCDFYHTDFSGIQFQSCEFVVCNLSLVTLSRAAFRDVQFKDCKMLGLRFDHCNPLGLAFLFDTCSLDHASFYKTKIRKTVFKNSGLRETDFTQCDLTGSVFENCDLIRATFANTRLEKADFRTSYNYSIDPENNYIKKAKFSLPGICGLLDKYDIEIDHG
jgi:uncharacterized protein YjbI with pentapeptide repeats